MRTVIITATILNIVFIAFLINGLYVAFQWPGLAVYAILSIITGLFNGYAIFRGLDYLSQDMPDVWRSNRKEK